MNGAAVLIFVMGGGVLLAAAWFAGSSPRFWWGLGEIVIKEALPDLKRAWEAYKATKTPEQWRKLREEADRQRRSNR